VLFQAVATGHGGIATMHADDSEAAIRRLQQKPMDIPPAYVPLMNCIITVKRVKLKTESVDGRSASMTARRVTEVTEVLSHNSLASVFSWNPEYDGYVDNLSKSRHLPKIALDTGIDMDDIRDDLARRRDILNWLQTRGIRDYRGISKVVGMFNQERDRLMEKVKST
jgi:flagellar protein FlaI